MLKRDDGFTLSVKLITEPITFQPLSSLDAPLFTGESLILSAVLLVPALLKALGAGWNRPRVVK